VSFDPFGDFATEGYLRNVEKETDLDIIKRLEHASFTTGLDEAFTALGKSRQVSYASVSALAQRAGFSVDWSATDKDAYLDALSKEIDTPSKGHLDNYLEQFIRDPIALEDLAAQVIKVPGLDGRPPVGDENEVVGNVDAPDMKAQYQAMLLKRGIKK
jgi:hypothetical protein